MITTCHEKPTTNASSSSQIPVEQVVWVLVIMIITVQIHLFYVITSSALFPFIILYFIFLSKTTDRHTTTDTPTTIMLTWWYCTTKTMLNHNQTDIRNIFFLQTRQTAWNPVSQSLLLYFYCCNETKSLVIFSCIIIIIIIPVIILSKTRWKN